MGKAKNYGFLEFICGSFFVFFQWIFFRIFPSFFYFISLKFSLQKITRSIFFLRKIHGKNTWTRSKWHQFLGRNFLWPENRLKTQHTGRKEYGGSPWPLWRQFSHPSQSSLGPRGLGILWNGHPSPSPPPLIWTMCSFSLSLPFLSIFWPKFGPLWPHPSVPNNDNTQRIWRAMGARLKWRGQERRKIMMVCFPASPPPF